MTHFSSTGLDIGDLTFRGGACGASTEQRHGLPSGTVWWDAAVP
ncbi:hypothetical protein ACIO13_23110 [Streptomyces sp. NPDC087425]